MFITRHTVKLCLIHWKRCVFLIGLTALLCIATGLLGRYLLQDTGAIEPLTLLVVDEDDSTESRLFYGFIAAADLYDGLILFEKVDMPQALEQLERGQATAVVRVPEGFAESVKSGENMPVHILYSEATPLKSQLVYLYADAFADMLRTSQIGVYTALEFARQYGDAASYQAMFYSSNGAFLTAAAERQGLFYSTEVSATGQVNIALYYVLHALVFLLLVSPVLLLDVLRPLFSGFVLGSLRRMGRGPVRVGMGILAGIFGMYLLLGGATAGLLLALRNRLPEVGITAWTALAALGAVLLAVSAAALLVSTLFRSTVAGGLVLTAGGIVSLALSGGILPTAFLAPWVRALGMLTPHYWAVRLLADGVAGVWNPVAYGVLGGFVLVCICFSCRLLGSRKRWEGRL